MVQDGNKDITEIKYNHLNLPTEISFVGGAKKIGYLYDAAGQKLRKTVSIGSQVFEDDYLDGFQYINTKLSFFPTAEGYVRNTIVEGQNNFNYVFNYLDHLGNIRMSYGIDPRTRVLKIMEENHYYPFGFKHANYNSGKKDFEKESSNNNIALRQVDPGDNPLAESQFGTYQYKYNGKEYQDELGLNFYDYGARMYDPAAPHFWQIDPKTGKYPNISPYIYVTDNPVNAIDPDGRDIIFVIRGINGNKDQALTYRRGNFYHTNGARYNPGKESLSPTLYKVLSSYRTIENSKDEKLKSVLHKLETSKLHHFVEAGTESVVSPYGIPTAPEKGSPVGTRTTYNFSKDDDAEFEKTEGAPDIDEATVAHEMRHQFDYDTGNHEDKGYGDENDPVEIRAVFFENLMRKELKKIQRFNYGRPIPQKELKKPANNTF